MKSPKFLFLILSLLVLAGCDTEKRSAGESPQTAKTSTAKPTGNTEGFIDQKPVGEPQSPVMQQVSLNQADQSQSMAEAMNRKILRNADLTLEVSDPQCRSAQDLVDRGIAGRIRRHVRVEAASERRFGKAGIGGQFYREPKSASQPD